MKVVSGEKTDISPIRNASFARHKFTGNLHVHMKIGWRLLDNDKSNEVGVYTSVLSEKEAPKFIKDFEFFYKDDQLTIEV